MHGHPTGGPATSTRKGAVSEPVGENSKKYTQQIYKELPGNLEPGTSGALGINFLIPFNKKL